MLSLANITLFLGNHCIFSNLNFQVTNRDRVGLVGPNGAGKTSLLRVIAGKYAPEEGSISLQTGTTIGYLEQEVLEMNLDMSIMDLALKAFDEVNKIEKRLDKISHLIETTTDYESHFYYKLLEEMEHLHHRFDILEGDRKETKTAEVLAGLGFSNDDLSQPVEKFSGGWRMRVLLAQLLLRNPDVLLLDEPTNHLDIDTIMWLEQYLKNYDGAVILVSHDRYFIDRMVTQIAEIRDSRIYTYTGNYESFLQQRSEMIDLQQRAYENQQKEISDTERFITRFRAKATKARQVQSRVKALERLDRIDAPEIDTSAIDFRFPDPPRCGKVVLDVQNLIKTYHPVDAPKIQVFTEGQHLHVERGDKIALIGPNGSGKSTLARILDGIEPFDGTRVVGHNVVISFFAQHLADIMESDRTILQVMEEAAKTSEARSGIRTLLGCFLFTGDDVFKPIKVLSGGERSRVALARTLLQPANFLVLDEPTNHLDITSKDVLVKALKEFNGTLLVVSHDRYFISGFANKIWRTGAGLVEIYGGGYDYYEWKSLGKDSPDAESIRNQQTGKNKEVASKKTDNSDKKKSVSANGINFKDQDTARSQSDNRNEVLKKLKPFNQELDSIEKRIALLELEKADIEMVLSDSEFYTSPESGEKVKRYAVIQQNIEKETDKWVQLTEQIEKITTGG